MIILLSMERDQQLNCKREIYNQKLQYVEVYSKVSLRYYLNMLCK